MPRTLPTLANVPEPADTYPPEVRLNIPTVCGRMSLSGDSLYCRPLIASRPASSFQCTDAIENIARVWKARASKLSSRAPRSGATSIALQACPVAHQSEVVALGAGFAGIAFHPRFAAPVGDCRLL